MTLHAPVFDDPVGYSLYMAVVNDPSDQIARGALRDWCQDNDPARHALFTVQDAIETTSVALEDEIALRVSHVEYIEPENENLLRHLYDCENTILTAYRDAFVAGPRCEWCVGAGCDVCYCGRRGGLNRVLGDGDSGTVLAYRRGLPDAVIISDPRSLFALGDWSETDAQYRGFRVASEIVHFHPVASIFVSSWVPARDVDSSSFLAIPDRDVSSTLSTQSYWVPRCILEETRRSTVLFERPVIHCYGSGPIEYRYDTTTRENAAQLALSRAIVRIARRAWSALEAAFASEL